MTQKKTILFVDDFKPPEWYGLKLEDTQVFMSAEPALEWAKNRQIDILFLDHDLGIEQMTGYTLLTKLIEEFNNPPKAVVIISLNGVGVQRIQRICEKYMIPTLKMMPPADSILEGQSG